MICVGGFVAMLYHEVALIGECYSCIHSPFCHAYQNVIAIATFHRATVHFICLRCMLLSVGLRKNCGEVYRLKLLSAANILHQKLQTRQVVRAFHPVCWATALSFGASLWLQDEIRFSSLKFQKIDSCILAPCVATFLAPNRVKFLPRIFRVLLSQPQVPRAV